MLLLTLTTDKIDLITSSTSAIDVHASMMDNTVSTGAVAGAKQNTAISSAATTDIVSVPGSGITRNVKTIHCRNKGAASNDLTVRYNANGTIYELFKCTLLAGDSLEYVEGIGFFVVQAVTRLDSHLRVTADVANSTTSFADITGLTAPVENGKFYGFESHLFHLTAITTTGAQFGVNGPTMTAMRVSQITTILGSVTAGTFAAPVGDTTTLDTAMIAETTGPATVVLAIISGYINPSANGTFAMRAKSEVAASAVTVKVGSWLHIWEFDN